MPAPVFRFAPSPNGRLHLGHAYSALLNQHLALEESGRLLLRIEDTDQSRCRPDFVQGVYEDLAWLGITWEEPVRMQSEHFAGYEANLRKLWEMQAIYPCFCSRRQTAEEALLAADPDGQPRYGGMCRNVSRELALERISQGEILGWRIDMGAWGNGTAAVWGMRSSPNVSLVQAFILLLSPMTLCRA